MIRGNLRRLAVCPVLRSLNRLPDCEFREFFCQAESYLGQGWSPMNSELADEMVQD